MVEVSDLLRVRCRMVTSFRDVINMQRERDITPSTPFSLDHCPKWVAAGLAKCAVCILAPRTDRNLDIPGVRSTLKANVDLGARTC